MTNSSPTDILIYQAPNGAIELRPDMDKETIWANQAQMANIFEVNTQAITKHLNNIYKEGELNEKATCSKMEQVQKEGDRMVSRKILIYNLDVLIAVGYRISSIKGTKFRQRATQTLKSHITQGYTINPSRISQNYDLFLKAVEEVKALSGHNTISNDDILELIKFFGQTWFSLNAYDTGEIITEQTTQQSVQLHAQQLSDDIAKLKQELIIKTEATELFAQEKNAGSLEGILGNVLQSAFGSDVYPSIESKAAHLLYFIIKNHPFTDGNKRSGAFAFVWFLQKVGYSFRSKITPQALTSITLLIATSDPKDKDRLIDLVMLLLGGK